MADVKISELTALTTPSGGEELVVNASGTTKKITITNATSAKAPLASPVFTGNVGINNSSPTQRLETNGNAQFNAYDNGSGAGGYYTAKGLQIGNAFDAGLSGGNDDRNAIVWNERGTSLLFGTTNLERLRIDHDGNVGIGTSSPSQSWTGGSSHVVQIEGGGSQITALRINESGGVNGDLQLISGASNEVGIYNFNNGPMRIGTNATERMRIDSAGNVGIGTSSPDYQLEVENDGTYASLGMTSYRAAASPHCTQYLRAARGSLASPLALTSSDAIFNISGWGYDGDSFVNSGSIQLDTEGTIADNRIPTYMSFSTHADSASSSPVERMRIDSSGFIGIGETSPVDKLHIKQNGDIGACLRIDNSNTSSAGSGSVVFERNGTVVGTIQLTGSATIYGTSSDYRLKENVVPMSGATAKTKLLKPCNFDWINFNENTDGFLAHELAEVVPDAVYGTKDAMRDEEYEVSPATGEVFTAGSEAGFTEVSTAIAASPVYYDVDGNVIKAEVIAQAAVHEAYEAVAEVIHSADVEQPETLAEGQQWRETTAAVMGTRSVPDMQGIDQAKLVPLLTATIQELIARIEALEA